LCAGLGGNVTLIHCYKGPIVTIYGEGQAGISCVVFDPEDANDITLGLQSGKIQIINARKISTVEDTVKVEVHAHTGKILCADIGYNHFFVSVASDGKLLIWEKRNLKFLREIRVPLWKDSYDAAQLSRVHVEFSEGKKHILLLCHSLAITLFDVWNNFNTIYNISAPKNLEFTGAALTVYYYFFQFFYL
jgi:WD40 repeat protein